MSVVGSEKFSGGGEGSPEQEARAYDKHVAPLGKDVQMLVMTMKEFCTSLGKPVPLDKKKVVM